MNNAIPQENRHKVKVEAFGDPPRPSGRQTLDLRDTLRGQSLVTRVQAEQATAWETQKASKQAGAEHKRGRAKEATGTSLYSTVIQSFPAKSKRAHSLGTHLKPACSCQALF